MYPTQGETPREYFNAVVSVRHAGAYRKRYLVPFGEYMPLPGALLRVPDFLEIPLADFSHCGEAMGIIAFVTWIPIQRILERVASESQGQRVASLGARRTQRQDIAGQSRRGRKPLFTGSQARAWEPRSGSSSFPELIPT